MPFFLIFLLYEFLNLLGAIAIILVDQANTAAA
jgi:hypothetical protein